jgi:hypothetical protein
LKKFDSVSRGCLRLFFEKVLVTADFEKVLHQCFYPSKTEMATTFINHKMAIFLRKINLKDVIFEKFS